MKKVIAIIMILVMFFIFAGCGKTQEEKLSEEVIALENKVNTLESEVSDLETQKEILEKEIVDIKVENGTAKYVVTFNIKQQHYSLDVTDYLKDSMNDVSIMIPVDKEYYDSIEVGDTIDDSFRMGSLIFKGSFGSWKITVENKEIQ